MNFSETFIRRPVATTLLMAGIGMFGVVAYRALPVSDLPSVDYPTLTVSASLPGADPATMASAVATPLERQFTTIAGIDSMTSSNSMGNSQITLQFDLDRKIDGAAVDVQTAIAAAMPLLPPGMPSPPSFRKVNPADSPIMFMTLTSNTMPLYKVDEYAETLIAQRISMVPGVAQVRVLGSQKYAVRVKVNPDKLAQLRIGINEVGSALANWNVNLPVGTIWGHRQQFNILANGQLMDAAAFRPLTVAYRNGAPVKLEQIANVVDSVEEERTASWIYQGDEKARNVTLMVMRQPGSNVIEVNDAIREILPGLQKQLPPSVVFWIRGDRSKNIREAFEDVQFTMGLTITLVILVIALFLRNIPATMIPAMALPFTILGTFAVIYLLGFSLNNISMMALILSIGFIVDDAIVMLENIVRHVEHGEAPMTASIRGSREIWFTILSMTISLAAVFIPLLFMSGILGRLFNEFAVTICVAVLISGFVSITLTPMLCSRMLRETGVAESRGRLSRSIGKVLDWQFRLYEVSLRWVVAHNAMMILVFFAVAGVTAYLYVKVPKGFIPDTDNDQLFINTEVAQGTGFEQMVHLQSQIAEKVRYNPDVEGFFSSMGGSGWGPATNGRMYLTLKPRRQREKTAMAIADDIRSTLMRSPVPGIRSIVTLPQAIRIGGRGSRSTYEFTLQSPDTGILYREATKLERAVAQLPIVQEVNSDLQIRTPRLTVDVDRDKAASLGLDFLQIEQALYNAYGPTWASTIYSPQNQFKVMLEVEDQYQAYGDMLSRLYLRPAGGPMVPLRTIAKIREDAGPQSINHTGQLPSVTISFNLKPGVSLGQAVDEIQHTADRVLPAGKVDTSFSGTAKAFQDSLRNMGLLLVIAIAVVYIVLGVLYESFLHPLTILSGLPSAGLGALLTLLIFRVELSIYAFVGLIMLVGLVKKNAIMQIDFALEAERKEGKTSYEAIVEGCLIRFRPIMMTTLAALFGSLPIALGYGAGGEARQPLGMAVVGGLVFSQLLTLFLTPVVYIHMARLTRWLSGSKTNDIAAGILPEVSS
ncbi:MAG: efflux RND transporter permease subunit [Bryobacterales bacterium]|nr:efflux RND transporter permease subunit [Bryobacterales bacterium]